MMGSPQGVIVLVISDRLRALRSSDFDSLNCTALGEITITVFRSDLHPIYILIEKFSVDFS